MYWPLNNRPPGNAQDDKGTEKVVAQPPAARCSQCNKRPAQNGCVIELNTCTNTVAECENTVDILCQVCDLDCPKKE